MPSSSQQTWTVKRTLDWCVSYLEAHDDEHPRRSAEWLMGAATGLSRVEIYAYFDKPLSEEERATLRESLKRRGAGEPLQYVTGESAFRHIVVRTAKGVLIPRPETEILVDLALKADVLDNPMVLEVGTGTGCIALSLAKEAGMQVTATDISPEAIECATRNAQVLGLDNMVTLVQTDCAADIEGEFDLLVSNPPYVPTKVMEGLSREVIGYEPHLALDGGEDGLDFFRRLLAEAVPLLRQGGFFACELHETCLDAAASLAEEAGMQQVTIHSDLTGRPRFLTAVRS